MPSPIHPGGVLEDALHARATTADALARATGLAPAEVKAILDEHAPITARVALLLGRYFGTPAEFWTRLQAAYDLDTARAELGNTLDLVDALPPRGMPPAALAHTPEPWRAANHGTEEIEDWHGNRIADFGTIGRARADRDRAVACVNYCAGLTDDDLRRGRQSSAAGRGR